MEGDKGERDTFQWRCKRCHGCLRCVFAMDLLFTNRHQVLESYNRYCFIALTWKPIKDSQLIKKFHKRTLRNHQSFALTKWNINSTVLIAGTIVKYINLSSAALNTQQRIRRRICKSFKHHSLVRFVAYVPAASLEEMIHTLPSQACHRGRLEFSPSRPSILPMAPPADKQQDTSLKLIAKVPHLSHG